MSSSREELTKVSINYLEETHAWSKQLSDNVSKNGDGRVTAAMLMMIGGMFFALVPTILEAVDHLRVIARETR
jgi:hypothetical protein